MFELSFSSKFDWNSYIIASAKTVSKKNGTLICSIRFLSPDVALCLCQFAIRSYMEYCCHIWTDVPGFYFKMLEKLQNRIRETVGRLRAASLEPLAPHRNVATLSLLYRHYFGRCSSELARLAPLPNS